MTLYKTSATITVRNLIIVGGNRMNELQREVLIGCCLGDISIQEVSNKTHRFNMTHSIKQGEYLVHKYNIFKDLCNTPYKQRDTRYPVLYFNTLSNSDIKKVTECFYNDGIRGVPQNIHEILTSPRSLAYWFMDDGTCTYNSIVKRMKVRNSTVTLCTDRYTVKEVDLLISTLHHNFGINSKIKHSKAMKDRYRIYIGTKDTQKFLDIVEPFIIPSMMYKVKRPYTL